MASLTSNIIWLACIAVNVPFAIQGHVVNLMAIAFIAALMFASNLAAR